jgi:hypothetical protein
MISLSFSDFRAEPMNICRSIAIEKLSADTNPARIEVRDIALKLLTKKCVQMMLQELNMLLNTHL